VQVVGVEVLHLRPCDLFELRPADLPRLVAVRNAGALRSIDRTLDQHGRRRRLGDEGERAIAVDGDLHRSGDTLLVLRPGVELLAELHDVDAVLTERGADRGRRIGLSAGDVELDEPNNLLRHGLIALSIPSGPYSRAPPRSGGRRATLRLSPCPCPGRPPAPFR